jgi:hypothetical protein
MSGEQNKPVGRHVGAELNRGNWAIVDEFVAADHVHHGSDGTELRGREASKLFMAEFGTAFPDFHMTIEDMIVTHRLRAMYYLLGL